MTEAERLEDWVPIARSMARSIGVAGALLLIKELGGTEYYIPRHVPEGHLLVQLLGSERAAALIASHGGTRIAIPRQASTNVVKGRIMELAEAGYEHRVIARMTGVTQRYVRRVVELLNSPSKPARSVDPRQQALPFAR